MLLDRVARLEERVAALESAGKPVQPASAAPPPAELAAPPAETATASQSAPLTFLDGTTLNLNLDAYYGFNFNNPIGRVNLLRAFDVSSNAFSLNQAGIIFDNLPDPDKGKRWGFRLDLQYGQATASLQGNPSNEPRPDIYRSIFQAYGSYVIPIGHGLNVDVGSLPARWASRITIRRTSSITHGHTGSARSLSIMKGRA